MTSRKQDSGPRDEFLERLEAHYRPEPMDAQKRAVFDAALEERLAGGARAPWLGVVWPALAGMEGYDAATRSVFVIDGNGTVQYAWATDAQGNEPPYDEVKAAAAALG